MAKSRSMAPPMMPMPDRTGTSASPDFPPVASPPKKASANPIRMAMAEPWMRPRVRYLDSAAESHMTTPTKAKAVRSALVSSTWAIMLGAIM